MMRDHFLDRDESEVPELAKSLFDSLTEFFSEEYARVNKHALGDASNKWAYINAYVNHADDKYMDLEYPSNWKRGCSFWGCIFRNDWLAKSSGSRKIWCVNKAKEILHIGK